MKKKNKNSITGMFYTKILKFADPIIIRKAACIKLINKIKIAAKRLVNLYQKCTRNQVNLPRGEIIEFHVIKLTKKSRMRVEITCKGFTITVLNIKEPG